MDVVLVQISDQHGRQHHVGDIIVGQIRDDLCQTYVFQNLHQACMNMLFCKRLAADLRQELDRWLLQPISYSITHVPPQGRTGCVPVAPIQQVADRRP